MSHKPHLCMIFEHIGPYSAIGRVAMDGVRIALDAGWRVTVVAKRLDESLQGEVEWLRLYVPRRGFAVQWLTARHFIKKALGGRTFDVVHAHQPQAACLADVFQCHFLTRVAKERACLGGAPGPRGTLARAQQNVALVAEDRFYGNWNPGTRMLYDSDLTRSDFHRVYGRLPDEDVLVYAFPDARTPDDGERAEARRQLAPDAEDRLVIGYLGGLHERKGYRRLVSAIERDSDLYLLMGGQYSETFTSQALAGRYRAMGLVSDIDRFYAACDVFVVPSHYEPLGLVAFEAAARGVPVIATPEVGALPHLLEFGAGLAWEPGTPLGSPVRDAVRRRAEFQSGADRMAEQLGRRAYADRLLGEYDRVLHRKGMLHPTARCAAGSQV